MTNLSLEYYTSIVVHLSLEPFHNAGLTPEETREVIEHFHDINAIGGSGLNLYAEQSGINFNWEFRVRQQHPMNILILVAEIERALVRKLNQKTGKDFCPTTTIAGIP